MYYIYEITNSVTGRKYIGQTINHVKRFNAHMANLRKGVHKERLMQRDYVLYGEESFDYKLLNYASNHQESIKLEKHYMIVNKTYDEEYGYNSQDAYFNKYQNSKPPINSQNYFYQVIKEKGVCLTKVAEEVGISLRTLIRNLNNPKSFNVKGFTKFVEVLGLDKEKAITYMGWNKPDESSLELFKRLDGESQKQILALCERLVKQGRC